MKARYAIGFILLCAFAWAFNLMPTCDRNGMRAAAKTRCIANLKQLATTTLLYQADHDDGYPTKGWDSSLAPYLKMAPASRLDFMSCPRDSASGPATNYGYALNAAVSGRKLSKQETPENTVLFFETDALGPGVIANLAARNLDRHYGKSNVAYADTSAKSFAPGQSLDRKR